MIGGTNRGNTCLPVDALTKNKEPHLNLNTYGVSKGVTFTSRVQPFDRQRFGWICQTDIRPQKCSQECHGHRVAAKESAAEQFDLKATSHVSSMIDYLIRFIPCKYVLILRKTILDQTHFDFAVHTWYRTGQNIYWTHSRIYVPCVLFGRSNICSSAKSIYICFTPRDGGGAQGFKHILVFRAYIYIYMCIAHRRWK